MTDDSRERVMVNGTAAGGSRILGSLRSADGKGVVRIEDRYETDAEDLWSAITDPQRLARWYGQVEGELRPGGEFRFFLEAPGLHGAGRVEACDRPRRLLVVTTEVEDDWRPGRSRPAFDTSIEAVLTGDGDTTTLVIEARGMPLEKVAYYGVGWQVHAENLGRYLAGEKPGEDDAARWEALVPSYLSLAATIG